MYHALSQAKAAPRVGVKHHQHKAFGSVLFHISGSGFAFLSFSSLHVGVFGNAWVVIIRAAAGEETGEKERSCIFFYL